MHHPDPVPFVSPALSERLRLQTDALRSSIIKANYNTQFAQTAPELAGFRAITVGGVDGKNDDVLSESFKKTIPFTSYDSYAPFVSRFFKHPCRASDVSDLLAPGLPDYLARSTSTSGGLAKFFPKYGFLSKIISFPSSWTVPDPLRRRTTAYISEFYCSPIHLMDESDCPVNMVYVAPMSVVNRRTPLNLHPEEDETKLGTFLLDHVAPYATGFITKYRSYLLVHVLFALCSRSLETMMIPYTSQFVDMMHQLDGEFDIIMDCIARGTIPDLDGITKVRPYLEMNMVSNPGRAAELRALGRPSSRPGWCHHAWPNLRSITTTASGSFATYLPSTRWFLGPDVEIHSRGLRSTEAVIGLPYNALELNQYKLDCESVIELLDINEGDSTEGLVQMWEVKMGTRYEVVLTTFDGLWRYRLGDVVEITGFDPTDGVPVVRFIDRRNMVIRFEDVMVTEKELCAAILSIAPTAKGTVAGWTTAIDERRVPATIGFFVELAGDQALDPTLVIQHVVDELLRLNENIVFAIKCGSFCRPTIRLVQPGAFRGFLQLKLDEGGHKNAAQVKVPVVLSKTGHVDWFLNHVVQEL